MQTGGRLAEAYPLEAIPCLHTVTRFNMYNKSGGKMWDWNSKLPCKNTIRQWQTHGRLGSWLVVGIDL